MRCASILRCVVFCAAAFAIGGGQAMAQPGAATLVSPNGEVQGSTTTFTWQAVPGSSWYLLWIGIPPAVAIEQWYTAQQVGCVPDTGTCSVTLTLTLPPGAYTWHIRTWSPAGAGSWSFPRTVSIKDLTPNWSRKLPNDRRFTLVFDGLAVLDNETGLVWERTPSESGHQWANGAYSCMQRTISGRVGWRLPSMSELQSLLDPSQAIALPPGHPFELGSLAIPYFWTFTQWFDTANVLAVSLNGFGFVIQAPKTASYRVLCVRGSGSERLQ